MSIEMRPLVVLVTGLQGTGKSVTANCAAELLGAPILAHDWAMSGLRSYPSLQNALDAMEPSGHRVVGWSILCALARAQLRRQSSVILDGMAGTSKVHQCRHVAQEEGAGFVLILTECTDTEVHRSRIERRERAIPNWYELDWDHVQRARERWVPPPNADLYLQATDSSEHNAVRLREFLQNL